MAKITLCAFSDESDASFKGQIDALKRNNIPYMEMRLVDGKNIIDYTIDEVKEYKKKMDDEGVAAWSLGSPIGKVDINVDFPQYLEKVKHAAEVAATMGTDKIRMFSFFNSINQREKVFEYLTKMVEVANAYGVNLYHENEKGIYGDNIARVQDIMNNVKGLKYIYDPANYLQVGEKALDTLNTFHNKTDYFHIKDVRVAVDALVPAGLGDGMIDELVRRITDEKVLTLEPHLSVFEGYSALDKTTLKHEYAFKTAELAFDTAVSALKKIIVENGYVERGTSFVK